MAFNPNDHIRKIGNKEYLDVAWRIAWFRDKYPNGRIETDPFTVGNMVYIKAIVMDNEGNFLASGLSTVRDATQREATWAGRVIEKAETAAIGRALAHAGFGAQFTGEDDGDDLADSPRADMKQAPKPQAKQADKLDPDTHLGAKAAPSKEAQWKQDLADLVKPLYDNEHHQRNGLKALFESKSITLEMSIANAAAIVFYHRAKAAFGLNEQEVTEICGKPVNEFKQSAEAFSNAWLVVSKAVQMPE